MSSECFARIRGSCFIIIQHQSLYSISQLFKYRLFEVCCILNREKDMKKTLALVVCVMSYFVFQYDIAYCIDSEPFISKGDIGWIVADNIFLRESISFMAPSVCHVFYGQEVRVLEIKDQWVRIKVDANKPGWVFENNSWEKARVDCKKIDGWINKVCITKNKLHKPPAPPLELKGRSWIPNNND